MNFRLAVLAVFALAVPQVDGLQAAPPVQTHVKTEQELEAENKKRSLIKKVFLGVAAVVGVGATVFVFRKPIMNFFGSGSSGSGSGGTGGPGGGQGPVCKMTSSEIVDLFEEGADADFDDQAFRMSGADENKKQVFKVFVGKSDKPGKGSVCGNRHKPLIYNMGYDKDLRYYGSKNPYAKLSNFWADDSHLRFKGRSCQHAEGVYGAMQLIRGGVDEQLALNTCLVDDPTVSFHKKRDLGRGITTYCDAMANGVNRNVPLLAVCLAKFCQPGQARKELLDTGDALLIEGVNRDSAKGGCDAKQDGAPEPDPKGSSGKIFTFKGDNRLGFTLMFVRDVLKKAGAQSSEVALNDAGFWGDAVEKWMSTDPSSRKKLSEFLVDTIKLKSKCNNNRCREYGRAASGVFCTGKDCRQPYASGEALVCRPGQTLS